MENNSEVLKQKLKEQRMNFQRILMINRADICQTMEDNFGTKVVEVIKDLVLRKTKEQWAKVAEKRVKEGKEIDIDGLIESLWEPLKDEFSFTVTKTNEGTQIQCTKCPLADMAKELETTKWGYIFFCMSDYGIVEGFNSKIGFKRTKTLMEGDDCCNHFYYKKD